MADALFEMKATADQEEWQKLARISFRESVDSMLTLYRDREHLLKILASPDGTKQEFLSELQEPGLEMYDREVCLTVERSAMKEHQE